VLKRWTVLGVAIAVVALMLGAVACSDDDEPDVANGDGATAAPTHDGASGEPREIMVLASDDFAFDPSEITLTAGEPVRLVLDNSDGALLHDLNIEGMPATGVSTEGGADHMMDGPGTDMPDGGHMGDDAGNEELHVSADAGDTAVLEFTPTEAGEYVFYCSVEGHRDAGMEGTITAE